MKSQGHSKEKVIEYEKGSALKRFSEKGFKEKQGKVLVKHMSWPRSSQLKNLIFAK